MNLGMKDVVGYDEVDFNNKRKIEFKLTCIACGTLHFTYIDIDDMAYETRG
ncbi:MAG: hypothetical protein ABUK08_00280 [Candidatus Humimicrobiaceae bacterium]